MQNKMMNEKETATDVLIGEKHLAQMYSTFLSEAATPEMVSSLTGLLTDTHDLVHHLYEEMNARGWYPVQKAQESAVNAAKQSFANMLPV